MITLNITRDGVHYGTLHGESQFGLSAIMFALRRTGFTVERCTSEQ